LKFWDGSSSYVTFNQSYYLSITEGGCDASKALVVNSTKDLNGLRNLTVSGTLTASTAIASPQLTTDTITKSGTLVINPSTLNLNPTTLSLRGSTVTASAAQLNYTAISTPGIAELSKCIVLDGSGNIDGINSLTSSNLFGTVQTAVQPNITSLGAQLSTLPINTPVTGDSLPLSSTLYKFNSLLQNVSSVAGSAAGIAFYCTSATPVSTYTPQASIVATKPGANINTGCDLSFRSKPSTGMTAASDQVERMRIGSNGSISFSNTITDTDWGMLRSGSACTLRFGSDLSVSNCYSLTWNYTSAGSSSNYLSFNKYGTSNTLVLTATDRVGIGTSTPRAALDVASSVASVAVGSGTTATATASMYAGMQSGTFSDTCSIYCQESLKVGVRGIYVSSDRRIKNNVEVIPNAIGVNFVNSVDPVRYELTCEANKRQLGYIAQSIAEEHSLLISMTQDEEMKGIDGDPWSPEGVRLSVSYERIIPLLHAALRDAFARIDELEKKING
jgi:hypothetical protein